MDEYVLSAREAAALTDERETCLFYEECVKEALLLGVGGERAGKQAANFLLQSGAKRANELGDVPVSELGISARQVAGIIRLREDSAIGSTAADELFGLLCSPEHAGADAREVAESRGMLTIRDEGALDAWCEQVIRENPKVAEDVRAGKMAAVGRLVGGVMKLSGGAADAAGVKKKLLERLGAG
jgi:aspartyl-tRNA(Asn)/glutamyl-tRNA(Gln) amidotransferase subunit B